MTKALATSGPQSHGGITSISAVHQDALYCKGSPPNGRCATGSHLSHALRRGARLLTFNRSRHGATLPGWNVIMGQLSSATSADSLDQLDQLCDAFEQAWRSGTRPQLEMYLAQAPDVPGAKATWFEELLRLEAHYLTQSGQPLTAEAYTSRFPDQAAIITRVLTELGATDTRRGAVDATTIVTDRALALGGTCGQKPLATATKPASGSAPKPPRSAASPDDTEVSTASTAFALSAVANIPRGNTCNDNPDDHTLILDGPLASRLWGNGLSPPPDFEVIKLVGRGGLGVVFKARQTSLDRTVALKLVLKNDELVPEAVRRFCDEAQAAVALRHPNIVAVHEAGEHAGQPYLAMDYVEGSNLAQRTRNRPLQPDRAAECIEKIARAIDHAHSQDVLHLNLKPANVLLDTSGTPLVSDFGPAARFGVEPDSAATRSSAGMPYYAAPEQAPGQNAQVGPATDVYALGAILYELLTGRPPFQAATADDTWKQILSDSPVAPRQLNAKVPKDLETICLQCLARHPADRYATAGELADDLIRYSCGEPVKARRRGPLSKLWRWCTRRPCCTSLPH